MGSSRVGSNPTRSESTNILFDLVKCLSQRTDLCHVIELIMAEIAQLGERQTEDLKVPGSIPGLGILSLPSRAV